MFKKLFLSLVILSVADVTFADSDVSVLPEFKYLAKDNTLEQVKSKQAIAKESGKMLILALGAEWCHDSRGLAHRFSNPELTSELKDKYEIEFIDVGYLDQAFDVAEYIGQDVYWGTPSVFIVDPVSGKVANQSSVWHWTSADALGLAEYKSYFLEQSYKNEASSATGPIYQKHLMKIKAFEKRQAKRLKAAYKVVGPLLKEYKESGNKASDEFKSAWDEVREYRVAVSEDMNRLYKMAKENADKGIQEALTFPSYSKFSWE